jgi:UTP:GlnB (protein PII) uridylyltransferase
MMETRVWVKIKDYPNLLSDLSMIFVSLGINVLSASITTQNGNALDTFRVEKDGKRISDELEDEIKLLIKLLEVQGYT